MGGDWAREGNATSVEYGCRPTCSIVSAKISNSVYFPSFSQGGYRDGNKDI